METHPHEVILYYDPNTYKGKNTYGYAVGKRSKLREIDITKEPFTGTQLLELEDMLGIPVHQLIDPANDKTKQLFGEEVDFQKEFSKEDLVKIIVENPEIIRHPIAIRGKRAIIVDVPADIEHL